MFKYSNIYPSLSPFPLNFITFLISNSIFYMLYPFRRCAVFTLHVFLSFIALSNFFLHSLFSVLSIYICSLGLLLTDLCCATWLSYVLGVCYFFITCFTSFKGQFLILFTIYVFVSVLRCSGHGILIIFQYRKKPHLCCLIFSFHPKNFFSILWHIRRLILHSSSTLLLIIFPIQMRLPSSRRFYVIW